jgi:hypothetical protein
MLFRTDDLKHFYELFKGAFELIDNRTMIYIRFIVDGTVTIL